LDTALLYKDGETSISDLESIVSTIAHELAHQWFGNLVTMEWWTE
jgi:puromycin-sensitive aminopeptidase